jgi:hypothetical protein
MSKQIEAIKNKYDVYNVEDSFNTFFSELVEKKYEGQKVERKEYYKMVIRVLLSVAILLSYFHPTPFPLDKPLIALCTVIYFILNYALELFDKHVLKNCFAEFQVSPSKFTGKKISIKPVLRMRSKVKLYSNNYELELFVDDLKSSVVVGYEDYVDVDGLLVENKLTNLFDSLIKKLK